VRSNAREEKSRIIGKLSKRVDGGRNRRPAVEACLETRQIKDNSSKTTLKKKGVGKTWGRRDVGCSLPLEPGENRAPIWFPW